MKKLFYLVLGTCLCIILASCEGNNPINEVFPTTFTFKCTSMNADELDDLGVKIDFRLYEYNEDDDQLTSSFIGNYSWGETHKFNANSRTTKVRVWMVVKATLPNTSFEGGKRSVSGWIENVYYLNKYTNTDIVVDADNDLLVEDMP